MPTYQYRCTACEHRFEAVQAFSDDALTECPECTGALRKVFSSVGIVFKGSGFYRTDSRNNGTVAAADAGSGGSATDSGSSTKEPAPKKKEAAAAATSSTPAPASSAAS